MIVFNGIPDISEVVEKNQDFIADFVDIKTNGFDQYCQSLNRLTFNFWKPVLDNMNLSVKDLGMGMKMAIKYNPLKKK